MNTKQIGYTLLSEGDSITRHLAFSDGKCFIEARDNDVVSFYTEYPLTNPTGLYWGRGLDIDGEAYNSDYLYSSIDRITVSNGVVKYSLKLDRLPMYAAYLINTEGKAFTIKSISINGVTVERPNEFIKNLSRYNLASYTQDYMSYRNIKTLEYSVVIGANSGDITLTASIDLSKDNKILLDCSTIQ
jgi:hypothetical protein|uniref:Uncharacterized protein n=1 Tax=Siphoviridae sp. ctoSr5 TaxID=2826460 RepID=A0A8S5MV18_9CAUD|nr:MAG TPA: hypothetical protein [Siphoviridae sp. ctoSr5]